MSRSQLIRKLVSGEYRVITTVSPTDGLAAVGRVPRAAPIKQISNRINLAGVMFNGKSRLSTYWGRANRVDIVHPDKNSDEGKVVLQNGPYTCMRWAPQGGRLALFRETAGRGCELGILEKENQRSRFLAADISAITGQAVQWNSDGKSLYVRITEHKKAFREGSRNSYQPIVTESSGTAQPLRTYQYLLQTDEDIRRLQHFLTSRVYRVGLDGSMTPITQPGLILDYDLSPDGQWLLIRRTVDPFSGKVPLRLFGQQWDLYNTSSGSCSSIATLPLAETLPLLRDAVRTGPRMMEWISYYPSMLAQVEAVDGGDPAQKTKERDKLIFVQMPDNQQVWETVFSGRIQKILSVSKGFLFVQEEWKKNNEVRNWIIDIDKKHKRLLHEYPSDSITRSPGVPLLWDHGSFKSAGSADGSSTDIFFSGRMDSATGLTPVLRRVDVQSLETTDIWEAPSGRFSLPIAPPLPATDLLLLEESSDTPPNIVCKKAEGDSSRLTRYRSPWRNFANVERRILRYQREDGVELSGVLYRPHSLKKDKQPLLIWAYPIEYKTLSAAGKPRDSMNRFLTGNGASPLALAALGFTVLDKTAMPIMELPEKDANDSFIEQCLQNAQAAVKAVEKLGFIDMDRIAIGGRSYGAFMTMNLIAHCDLFRAAIACSGAYNRTLTPFGFQHEERTLWQAPETYLSLSPLLRADKINTPVLMIHGEKDENPGTHPAQSRRMFEALNGHGKTARLTILPEEGHQYRSREAIEVVVNEMANWLDLHLEQPDQRR